jgi:ATP-dependent DNA helicase 2 subunit 2
VIKAGNVKKVPPKARGKRSGRKAREDKPLSELDIGALLAADPQRNSTRIDPKNAIPEFKNMVAKASREDAEDEEAEAKMRDAGEQLMAIIFDWIRHSVGNSGYGKSIEAIRVMRDELGKDMEQTKLVNDFLQDLKKKLLSGDLGGDRREMWLMVRQNKLGLLSMKDDLATDVTEEQAKAFLGAR